MYLLIDDERDLNCDVIARNPIAGMKLLALGGWECVCFDHDLGDELKNGYDVLCWAGHRDFLPEKVQLVTANPVGRKNMQSALAGFGYTTKDGINFRRI